MFNDIGPLEVVTLVVLAVLVFGPDKLPKLIQDVSRTIRKIREFSDSAKEDIRSELGPEFKDFEFEDLNPKTFIRKQLDSDELGLKEIRNGFDLKKEMADLTDAVHTVGELDDSGSTTSSGTSSATSSASGSGNSIDMRKRPDMEKRPEKPAADAPPPFDADAT
ncbi:sec-independent translocase [Streptomyces sp. NPDC102467]|uniref:sec-independent translocase n=1 Tax=Streptomyces sp. NPDC102467 TaxID=3366179 RepID=UPI0037F19DA4